MARGRYKLSNFQWYAWLPATYLIFIKSPLLIAKYVIMIRNLLVFATFLLVSAVDASAADTPVRNGIWRATLTRDGQTLPFLLDIKDRKSVV